MIVKARFMKSKRQLKKAMKKGRRRATKKAKEMMNAIKEAFYRTQIKNYKRKIIEAKEKVDFSHENLLLAEKDANVEEITDSKKELKNAKLILKFEKRCQRSITNRKVIMDSIDIANSKGDFKIIRKLKKHLRIERKKFKKAQKVIIRKDLVEAKIAVKDAVET